MLAIPGAAPPVGATYGTDPGSTAQILATVRPDGIRQSPRTGDSVRISRHPVIVEQPAAGAPAQARGNGRNPAWPVVTTPPTGVPPGWLPPSDKPAPPATPAPTPTPKPTGPVLAGNPVPVPPTTPASPLPGFDACAAPSLPTMKAWRAKYAAAGIYIGGQMMGCRQSNLSASWVQQAKAMGWSLLPTFVGLQAPCDGFSGKIDPKQAASQGTAAASQAVAAAASYGLGAGSPIYYDMEAYNNTNAGCRTAVLTFLDAWTRQLQAQHYVPVGGISLDVDVDLVASAVARG